MALSSIYTYGSRLFGSMPGGRQLHCGLSTRKPYRRCPAVEEERSHKTDLFNYM